jgi:RNA polymerase sigma factor (sigma-70 family)
MMTTQFLQSCQSGDEDAIETLVRTHQRAVFQLALSVIDDGPLEAGANGASAAVAADVLREAETATRETFVTALDRLGRYREDTPFEPWLFRIAVQVSRRRYRLLKLRRQANRLLGRARSAAKRPGAADDAELPSLLKLTESGAQVPAAHTLGGKHAEEPAAAAEKLPVKQPAAAERQPVKLPVKQPAAHDVRFQAGDADLWASVRALPEKLRLAVVLRYYHDMPIGDIARVLGTREGAIHARLDAARERIAREKGAAESTG